MADQRLPWSLRGSDFAQPQWHTEPTSAYQLMFEFLVLSPSYELARRARSGALSAEDKRRAPSDFQRVLKIYDLLGDVNCVPFRQWWLERGLSVFGNPYTRPKLHQVALLAAGENIEASELQPALQAKLIEPRQAEGLSPALLVSLPLSLKRSEVLRLVRKALDEHRVSEDQTPSKPKLRLMGERFHPNAMLKGLRLLWFKAAKPQWENWRLGAKARISDSYSQVLDPAAPRRTTNPIEMDDRITMGKITYRAVRRFELIVENAARGRFPCTDAVPEVDFEYPELAKRLQMNSRWLRNHKQEWIKNNLPQAS